MPLLGTPGDLPINSFISLLAEHRTSLLLAVGLRLPAPLVADPGTALCPATQCHVYSLPHSP